MEITLLASLATVTITAIAEIETLLLNYISAIVAIATVLWKLGVSDPTVAITAVI